jgi:hypothetical protein
MAMCAWLRDLQVHNSRGDADNHRSLQLARQMLESSKAAGREVLARPDGHAYVDVRVDVQIAMQVCTRDASAIQCVELVLGLCRLCWQAPDLGWCGQLSVYPVFDCSVPTPCLPTLACAAPGAQCRLPR